VTLTTEAVPYTGLYGSDATKHDSSGKTIEALKRAMVRLGYLDKPLNQLDEKWAGGSAFDQAFGRWSIEVGLQNDHMYGEQKWTAIRKAKITSGSKKGEYALDLFAQDLIRQDHLAQQSSPSDRVRGKIVAFCEQGLRKPGLWNYTQNRPVKVNVDPWGTATINSDCSGSVIQAFHYAKRVTGLAVNDPAQQGWSGYGNTDLYEDDWPTVTGSYKVGDLGHYRGHVTLCIKAGDWGSSEWWSFGSEPPSRRRLNYRSDFRKVVRPVLL
jgi:hypothetical protein